MEYDRVVSATMSNTAFTAADKGIIELQMPGIAVAEIIRIEIGLAEGADPLAESQEINFYANDAVGSGTAVTEKLVSGAGTIVGVAITDVTEGATPTHFHFSAMHWSVGYLYLPVPEERYQIVGGSSTDNFGFQLAVAPDASTTFSATMVWGELG